MTLTKIKPGFAHGLKAKWSLRASALYLSIFPLAGLIIGSWVVMSIDDEWENFNRDIVGTMSVFGFVLLYYIVGLIIVKMKGRAFGMGRGQFMTIPILALMLGFSAAFVIF